MSWTSATNRSSWWDTGLRRKDSLADRGSGFPYFHFYFLLWQTPHHTDKKYSLDGFCEQNGKLCSKRKGIWKTTFGNPSTFISPVLPTTSDMTRNVVEKPRKACSNQSTFRPDCLIRDDSRAGVNECVSPLLSINKKPCFPKSQNMQNLECKLPWWKRNNPLWEPALWQGAAAMMPK